MSFLLDTCLVSELVRPAPEPAVLAWLGQQDEQSLFLSVLTLGELQKGAAKLPAGNRKQRIQRWIEEDLCQRFAGRILPVDVATASLWGKTQGEAELRGKPMPTIDGLIAATALAHRLSIVTRNGADMAASGATIINPWPDQARTSDK